MMKTRIVYQIELTLTWLGWFVLFPGTKPWYKWSCEAQAEFFALGKFIAYFVIGTILIAVGLLFL